MKLKITKQVKTILFIGVALLAILFLFRKVTEGFADLKAYDYVDGKTNGPFKYDLAKLKSMAGGKAKISAINFYQYYDDGKGKKGYILQDDPSVGLQNQLGGPSIEFVKNVAPKKIYSSLDPQKTGPEFPLALTDARLSEGILITNTKASLGGNTESPLSSCASTKTKTGTNTTCTPKLQFQYNKGVSPVDPGKGKNLKIEFIFTD